MSNTQKKVGRVRPPRVQITYDVEVGDEIQMKELPFIVGVLADLSAQSKVEKPKMKDRKFVEIDGENFSEVMQAIAPRLEFRVENKLTEDGGKLPVELNFNSMDDFTPYNVIQQVPQLKKLYEAKTRLQDLHSKLDGNDELEDQLQKVMNETSALEEIKAATTAPDEEEGSEEAAE